MYRNKEWFQVTWFAQWRCDDHSIPKLHYPGVVWSSQEKQPFDNELETLSDMYEIKSIQYLPYGAIAFQVALHIDVNSVQDNNIFDDAYQELQSCAENVDDDGNHSINIHGDYYLAYAKMFNMTWIEC